MIKLYGIKNCDTVRKAIKALSEVDYEFVDFKKTTLTDDTLLRWKTSFGDWPVNKRGRTFKQHQQEFEDSNDAEKLALLRLNTSMLKRPVLEHNNKVLCFGYDESIYNQQK